MDDENEENELEQLADAHQTLLDFSLEYLSKTKTQAGVVILREIRPEYAIPVGVWQVREAMKEDPEIPDSFDAALSLASSKMSISKSEWLAHGNILSLMRQKTLSDFF